MKQQTNQDVLNLLNKGGIVTIKLTGVSFDNRQQTIKNMMENKSPREIQLQIVTDKKILKYDNYAINVLNYEGESLGFIPKFKIFSITLPKRRRPVSFSSCIEDKYGNPIQTNQIFHQDMLDCKYTGVIDKYLSYGSSGQTPIGVQIRFWKV